MEGGATKVPGVVEHELSIGAIIPATLRAIAPVMMRPGFIDDCD
jgi:hypothetical protein